MPRRPSRSLQNSRETLKVLPAGLVHARSAAQNPLESHHKSKKTNLFLSKFDNSKNLFALVLDVLGRKVLEQKENITQINIQFLEKGLYQLILSSEGKNYSSKFIKE